MASIGYTNKPEINYCLCIRKIWDTNSGFEDNSIITYVAGSISRSLLKKMPKSHSSGCCISMITRGTSIRLATDEESDSSLQDAEFISLVSRGGLQHPSDCLFITCVHAYQLYERVRGDKNFDAILMGSSNPEKYLLVLLIKRYWNVKICQP